MDIVDLKNKKLLYIDNFKNSHNNNINLACFKKYYQCVVPINIRWIGPIQMRLLIWKYKPDHVFYGGSVKVSTLVRMST
jgi:hypothetical protein